MHPQPYEPPVEIRLSEAEAIALAYRQATRGNGWAALVRAIEDALADLVEAERHIMQGDRLISHGFVRSDTPTAAGSAR